MRCTGRSRSRGWRWRCRRRPGKGLRWREGSDDWLASRFTRLRVRVAHDDHKLGAPRAEEWLLIEWPEGDAEPTKYWLSSLPEEIAFERLVDIAKLRWRIERDYRELKQEIGLGHYEGRGWRGFHHHASMCIAAYGFLICEQQTIPPSGPGAAPPFEEPALPQGRRLRGTADPHRTAHPRLHRHRETPSHRRPRQAPATMSLLPTDIPTPPVESASLVTQ